MVNLMVSKLLSIILISILLIVCSFLLQYEYRTIEKFSTIMLDDTCPNNESPDYYHYNKLYNRYREYFNRDYLVHEGIRRNKIHEGELARLKTQLNNGIKNNTLTLKERLLLEQEMNSNKWRNNIFQDLDKDTKKLRYQGDIITDYNPNIIGCPRRWMECHKWIS